MKQVIFGVLLVALIGTICAETFFYEPFAEGWEKNWVKSTARSDYGEFKWTAGDWYGDKNADKGIQTGQDARHYAISAKFTKPVTSNKGKKLIIQFSAKHPQGIDCGGAYLKIASSDNLADQKNFKGGENETPYGIMFGPDICGSATRRVHFIFNYKGKNLLWKKTLACETDKLTHLYTAVINPDQTYEVLINGEKKESGTLEEDWEFLPPKKINDPNAKKPSDWVDDKEIPDVNDKKPADWDSEPQFIEDPEAKKPEDWNDEEDGKWEAPKISNPKWKGEWKQKMIPNPAYKGPWVPPQIDNPDYKPDSELGVYKNLDIVGIEIWQVKAGTIFDDILITDSVEEAQQHAKKTLENKKGEKKMFDEIEEANRKREAEEAKKREAEEAKKKEEEEAKKKESDAKKSADKEEEEIKKAAEEAAKLLKEESSKDKTAKDEL